MYIYPLEEESVHLMCTFLGMAQVVTLTFNEITLAHFIFTCLMVLQLCVLYLTWFE